MNHQTAEQNYRYAGFFSVKSLLNLLKTTRPIKAVKDKVKIIPTITPSIKSLQSIDNLTKVQVNNVNYKEIF